MSKILDSTVITAHQPKMVELRKGFLINGQYYLKDKMQAVPFMTVPLSSGFSGGGDCMLHLNKVLKCKDIAYYTCAPEHDLIVYDTNDERYTYVFMRAYSNAYLVKFSEEDNQCKYEGYWSTRLCTTSNGTEVTSVYEKDEYIIAILGGADSYSYKYYINKKTMQSDRNVRIMNDSVNSSYPYDVLCQITNKAFYRSTYSPGTIFSHEQDDSDTFVSVTLSDTVDVNGNRNNLFFNNAFNDNEDEFIMMYPNAYHGNNVETYFKNIIKVRFDKNTKKWSQNVINLDSNGFANSYIKAGYNYLSDVWYKTINDKDYMIVYNRANYGQEQSRVIIIEFYNDDDTEKAKIVKIQEMPVGQSGRILQFKDDEKIAFYGYNRIDTSHNSLFTSIYKYEFSEANLEFIKTFSLNNKIREFGFDKDRNMYIMWEDKSVSRYNETSVANFNAHFEENLYEYEGEEIETNMIVSITNIDDEFLEREVTLDIRGNAKFKSTGSKTITTTTSSEGTVKIPVIITGSGALSVFPKVKA